MYSLWFFTFIIMPEGCHHLFSLSTIHILLWYYVTKYPRQTNLVTWNFHCNEICLGYKNIRIFCNQIMRILTNIKNASWLRIITKAHRACHTFIVCKRYNCSFPSYSYYKLKLMLMGITCMNTTRQFMSQHWDVTVVGKTFR